MGDGGRWRGLVLAAVITVGSAAGAEAQAPSPGYLDHDGLTDALEALVESHGDRAELTSLATTREGRDLWLVTLGSRSGTPRDERPALLLVANLEANRVAGSAVAVGVATSLLERYGSDEAVTRLLDEGTVYLVPRANPDGAERVFTLPGVETPYKPHPSAPERGGLNVREWGADLDGDGLVGLMRVEDPEGTLIPHPDEPRLLREADRAREERGRYRVMVEGIDPDDAEAYVQAGTDGVDLNRNFQHEYLYFHPHVGPHMVSEVESRALVDFVFDHPNIAAVLTWSAYDNLRSAPPERRQPPDGVTGNPPQVPTNLLEGDRPYVEYVGERFRELTGMGGSGAPDEAGSFPQFVYYQAGLPSFTTPVWTVPAAEGRGSSDPVERDRRWLAFLDSAGVDAFVEWSPATHPTLGEVEVGGFRPNVRVNPPESELPALVEGHAAFVSWLGGRLPEVRIVETGVEPRGDGVWQVTATLANEGYFPTRLEMGERIRFNRPVTVRLTPAEGMKVLSGNIQEQVSRIEGMGGRSTHTWLVQAPAGTRTTVEVFAERAGGLLSDAVTLR